MASVIQPLAIGGSRKLDGSANSGGRVFLSRIDAPNSPVVGYGDRDASAAIALNGGGYMLDVAGRAAIFVKDPCRVHIEDSSGVPVDSFTYEPTVNAGLVEVISPGFTGLDPNTGQLTSGQRTYLAAALDHIATSLGGVDGNFLVGAGATGQSVQSAINALGVSVKSFGALGNGVHDDTTQIQSAVNFVSAAGGGVVNFPPGNYHISSAINVLTGNMILRGSGSSRTSPATRLFQTNTSSNGIVIAGGNALQRTTIENMTLETSIVNNNSAVLIGSSGTAVTLYRVTTSSNAFRTVLNSTLTSGGSGQITHYIQDSYLQSRAADTSGVVVACNGNEDLIVTNSTLSLGSISGISWASTGRLSVSNSTISADGADGVGILATAGTVVVSSSTVAGSGSAASHEVSIGASVSGFTESGMRISSAAGTRDILDSRTASTAPVSYSLSTSSAVVPLPFQSSAIRIVATAAITVTVSPIAASGFGKKWSLKCINNSGGAVTWSFDAQYKLSAAVAPATGNQVNLLLEYDPIAGKVYELGRSPTAI